MDLMKLLDRSFFLRNELTEAITMFTKLSIKTALASIFLTGGMLVGSAAVYAADTDPNARASEKANKDKDFEHERAQTDGTYHPREGATGAETPKQKAGKTSKPTKADKDRDKDFEHERAQTDGTVHPREADKK